MRLDTGMDFGPWLARQLKQSGMSQADLAHRVGMTRAAVSAWITGRATPREETIHKIAEALGTSQSAVNRIERGNQNISLEMIARIGEAHCPTTRLPRSRTRRSGA
ncbi:hypothetical protein ACZ90_44200 [Streptomyces albus subsp. albus]|nr:hypothetical protein ACZ90_44200 [Streptomyces albus subsp. albus]